MCEYNKKLGRFLEGKLDLENIWEAHVDCTIKDIALTLLGEEI